MAARKNDAHVRRIQEVLEREYLPAHSKAKVEARRYNSVSVRIRVIDPSFAGKSKTERDDAIWKILDELPDETRAEVSMLLLFTPEEARTSLMNLEFEQPTPSLL